ncbi:MAG TPA: L,D-transpeptidase [Gemmatimonadaceae bacterium]|nr:L,D-transpeptidase [Gemmatimonadaceae bacterium]
MLRFAHFLRRGGPAAWLVAALFLATAAASTALLASTLEVRYERDVARMVFNDNLELLESVRREVGVQEDTLARLREAVVSPAAPAGHAFIVVSIAENRLWYRQGDSVLFTAPVATGSGKTVVRDGSGEHWKFETPRGRLVVLSKEEAPMWVPPDWHFVEAARTRGLGVVHLYRGQSIPLGKGVVLTTQGSDVVRRYPDGRVVPYSVREGREIVANGNIVIPPFGTNQRKYPEVLGTHRLNLGDGYALHGTNQPATVGRSVSHGCIRLRNGDIARLYEMVPVGTPVYVY